MSARTSLLFVAISGVLMSSALAHAALPSASQSTTPTFIRLVGGTPSGPDVTDGLFTVTVRDGSGGTIEGSRVTVSFCGAGDLRICQDQLNPAYTVDCVAGTVSALTDPQGEVSFTILGAADGQGVGSSLRGTVQILADDPVTHQNVLLSDTSPTTGLVCSAPDLNGIGGVGAADFSLFANDLSSSWQRSDFDGSGTVDANDQALLTTFFASARMTVSCPAYCASCATSARKDTWGGLKLRYR